MGTQLGKRGGGIEILGTAVHAVGHSATGFITHSYPRDQHCMITPH